MEGRRKTSRVRIRARTPRVRVAPRDMDDGARNWLFKTATKNYWRVAAFCDLDDLIQDGFMCYYLVLDRYRDAVDRPHVMRLFQTIFNNHIHDTAKARTRHNGVLEHVAAFDALTTPADVALADLPPYLQKVCAALTDDTKRNMRLSRSRCRADGTRETMNERLCRLAGLDPSQFNVVKDLRERLGAEPSLDDRADQLLRLALA